MTKPKKSLVHVSILIAALWLSAATVSAKDDDFKMLVKQVESHYQAKRLRIPLFAPSGVLGGLSPMQQNQLKAQAATLAEVFQRSSSKFYEFTGCEFCMWP